MDLKPPPCSRCGNRDTVVSLFDFEFLPRQSRNATRVPRASVWIECRDCLLKDYQFELLQRDLVRILETFRAIPK